jgi:probable F420-dependent oxidoreductase
VSHTVNRTVVPAIAGARAPGRSTWAALIGLAPVLTALTILRFCCNHCTALRGWTVRTRFARSAQSNATGGTRKVFQMPMITRPFRFGLLVERFSSHQALLQTTRQAEAAGFSTLLIRDHFIEQPFGHQFAPLVTLAAAAQATTTLRMGTLVVDNDYRHPALLAKEAATLDLLSDGRFELGLGAGWAPDEYAQIGMSFDPPGARISRLIEGIQVLKGLWGQEPFRFDGKHYRIGGLDNFPKPVQKPHPPLLIGAGGKRMLELGAREADIIGIMASPIRNGVIDSDPSARLEARMAEKVGWIRHAAGPRFEALELSVLASMLVTNDRRRDAREFAEYRGWHGVTADSVLDMPAVLIGTIDQISEDIRARRNRVDLSYFIFADRDLESAAPLVERLSGT